MFFHPDASGRNMLVVTNSTDGSQITIYQQGGHISSWKTADGEEHLYNSPKTIYADGKAIRGGVPLIFPQFSDLGPLSVSHGFLRVSNFELKGFSRNGSFEEVQLEYCLRPGMQKVLPEANVDVLLIVQFSAARLQTEVKVTNHSNAEFEFAFAFHTYFAANVKSVEVRGLDETSYLDNLQDRKPCPPAPVKYITEEIDRIYLNQKTTPVFLSYQLPQGGKKTLTIKTDNFKDVVLWNPWIEKTKQTKDLPEDAYQHFVCVEHGTIMEKEKLKSQQTWHAAQIVDVAFTSSSL